MIGCVRVDRAKRMKVCCCGDIIHQSARLCVKCGRVCTPTGAGLWGLGLPALFLLVMCWACTGSASGKDRTQRLVERYDAPTATTFYNVVPTPSAGKFFGRFLVLPYLGAKRNQVWLRLRIEPTLQRMPDVQDFTFEVDGEATTLDLSRCQWHQAVGSFADNNDYCDYGGGELETLFRKIASASDVYLIVSTSGPRLDIHLDKEEHRIPFHLVMEKYDALRTENSKPVH